MPGQPKYPEIVDLAELLGRHGGRKDLAHRELVQRSEFSAMPYRTFLSRARNLDKTVHISPQGVDTEPDVLTTEGRKTANLKTENAFLAKENKRLRGHLLDQENLVDRIVSASTRSLPRPDFKVRRGSARNKPVRDVLLPLFDLQYGSRVRPEDTVNGVGGFDAEVFAARLKTYVEKAAKTIGDYASGHTIRNLVFCLGGDMVEGDEIYKGQDWHLCLHPSDQVMQLRDLLAYAIEELLKVGADLGATGASILAVPGNHGKVGGKKSGDKPPGHSWDVLVFKLVKERLKNHPIKTFAIEEAGACYFDVSGNLFGMIHGDEIKGWGGIPFYGITRHDAKMIRTANLIPDYVLLGHHHQPASIPTGYGEWLMSGNWVGGTTLSKIVGSNTPSQWLYFVSEAWGVCDRSLIYLDERRKPQAHVYQTA